MTQPTTVQDRYVFNLEQRFAIQSLIVKCQNSTISRQDEIIANLKQQVSQLEESSSNPIGSILQTALVTAPAVAVAAIATPTVAAPAAAIAAATGAIHIATK